MRNQSLASLGTFADSFHGDNGNRLNIILSSDEPTPEALTNEMVR